MLPCTGRMMTLSPVRSSSATLGGGSSDSREPLRLGTLRGQDHHRGTLTSTRGPTATLCGAVPLTVGDRHCRRLDFGDAATFPLPEPLPQQPLDGVRRWLPCHPWVGLSTPEKGGLGLWGGGVPTLTLVNWEVEEVSLSVLLPAPRVLFSSAARSGGAPNIRTPPLYQHPKHPNTMPGLRRGRIHPYATPSPPRETSTKAGGRTQAPCSGCQILPAPHSIYSPEMQPSFRC